MEARELLGFPFAMSSNNRLVLTSIFRKQIFRRAAKNFSQWHVVGNGAAATAQAFCKRCMSIHRDELKRVYACSAPHLVTRTLAKPMRCPVPFVTATVTM